MSDHRTVEQPSGNFTLRMRYFALGMGIACHVLFLAAVLTMALALFGGLQLGMGPFTGIWAILANGLLLASFPVFHSWLLSARGRQRMQSWVPMGLGKALSSTIFASIASIQLLAIFWLWSPSHELWWTAQGRMRESIGAGALIAWLFLGKAMYDAQLSLQTGFLGWSAVWKNQMPEYSPFSSKGLFSHVRQPIYMSFAALLWLSAVWTPDQLAIALAWTTYCIVGSVLKEKRYAGYFGQAFGTYQTKVPFWGFLWPRLLPAPVSAAALHQQIDVVIAGGGPVGLLLANILGSEGLSVMVAEQRMASSRGSMAIGITPPSMGLLKELGLGATFEERGVRIRTARVFENGMSLGSVDFSRLPDEHRYILSLPQCETIAILREGLTRYPNVQVLDGVGVCGVRESAESITVVLHDRISGALTDVRAAYVAACDGARSTVRSLVGIPVQSHAYQARFVMADFQDDNSLGQEAHLYFGRVGSLESFPLPNGSRRWIVQDTGRYSAAESTATRVARAVRERTGIDLNGRACSFESRFQPQWALARTYVRGRVLLCGDAAHVMSPIGGQGMNTGFMDAAQLARSLVSAMAEPCQARTAFARYTRIRKKAFHVAARRAAISMWLGTRTGVEGSFLRAWFVQKILLRRPLSEKLAPHFAMLTIPGRIRALRPSPSEEGAVS